MLCLIEQMERGQKSYRFAEGHRGERGNPVTEANLRVALGLQGGSLSAEGEDLPVNNILFTLKENHRTLDQSLTIRYVCGEPLINLRCGNIGAIILMHHEACKSQGIDPEVTPMHLYWSPEMGQRTAMKINQRMAPVPDNEQGSINMYDENQVVLSYREWHLVPLSDRVMLVKKNLQVVPTFAKTVKDLCTNGMVIIDDGRLIRERVDGLWIMDLEADKVIAGVDLNGFPPTKLEEGPDDGESKAGV